MTKLEKLRERGKQICDTIEKEKRNATESEEVELLGLEIAMRQEELVEGKTKRSIPLGLARGGEPADHENEFQTRGVIGGLGQPAKLFWNGRVPASGRTIRQYLSDVMTGATLVPDEERAMNIGTGAQGGFAAPEAWEAGFWSAVNNESVFLPRCRVFNFQGTNTLHITAWDSENQSAGPVGGVGAQWVAEGGTFTPVTPAIRSIMLKANKLGIFVDISREAAQNAGNLMSELGTQMVRAASYYFDNAVMNGTGIGQPLGILQSGSAVNVSRAVGSQISYADIVDMYERIYPGFIAGAAWFASPDTIGQLLTMTDAASSLIWMPSQGGVAVNRPGYLLGLPVYLTDKCAALGTRGDLVLADLSAYALAVAQDVVLEKTESARWFTDQYSLRSILRGDGIPLMDAVITPRNSGQSLSWAVVLN